MFKKNSGNTSGGNHEGRKYCVCKESSLVSLYLKVSLAEEYVIKNITYKRKLKVKGILPKNLR